MYSRNSIKNNLSSLSVSILSFIENVFTKIYIKGVSKTAAFWLCQLWPKTFFYKSASLKHSEAFPFWVLRVIFRGIIICRLWRQYSLSVDMWKNIKTHCVIGPGPIWEDVSICLYSIRSKRIIRLVFGRIAGWFGKNKKKQLLGCIKMNRTLKVHENTQVSIYLLCLKQLINILVSSWRQPVVFWMSFQ